jgi:hypothetical protein
MQFAESHRLETYKSLVAISIEAFKALQLVNGAAIVVLLGYLGQVSGRAALAGRMLCPLVMFILGLTLGTIAFATSYLTQFALFNESVPGYRGRPHTWWLWWTFGIALSSLVTFAVGAVKAVLVLSTA